MPCSATTWAATLLAAATTLCAAATAQQPRSKSILYALLEDPAGNPVAGAKGWLRPEPSRRLLALPELPPEDGRPGPWPTATSDARGLLRFGDDRWRPGAGSGLVTTEAGLGAVLPRLVARRLQQVTLEPMAELSTPNASEPFTLYARARLPDGGRVVLPPQRGARVRLPAGDYEVWAQSADGWTWRRVALRSGDRTTLRFDGAAQRLRLPQDAYLHPQGWPTMPLHSKGDDREVLLRGGALDAALVTWAPGRVTAPTLLPKPPEVRAIDWPPPAPHSTETATGAIPGATYYGLVRGARGDFALVARSAANDAGVLAMRSDPGGDSWLLAVGDFAPAALPWSAADELAELRADRGVELTVRARNRQQLPVADLVCVYEPDGMPAAAVVARTDANGRAAFGRCRGPGVLWVQDPRYANQRRELSAVPVQTLALEVDRGARCAGVATFADGAETGTVVVTLRDPSGALRPAERTQTVGPGEPFQFDGLPEGQDFVLLANAFRGGKTWTARAIVRSGTDSMVLVLADEDPTLGR